jgi:hypothetical protein
MRRFVPLLLAACHYDAYKPIDGCTEIAMSSLTLTVTDEHGEPVAEADVTFTVDGGAVQSCDPLGEGQWVCGYEQAGSLTVTVEVEGYEAHEETVQIDKTDDDCHVIGQELEVSLDPVACNDDAVIYAVTATLSGSSGETLDSPEVWWGWANADMAPVPCEASGEVWLCAPDQWGALEILGTAGGHTTDMEAVMVAVDASGCHPVPEEVALVVEWLPD